MFDSMWPSYVYLCIFLLVQRYFIWLIIYAVTNFYFWMEYFPFKVNRSMYIHILCTSIIFILILKWPTVIGTSWWSNLHRCWPQQEAGQAACCRSHADPAWLQQTLSPACQTCHQVGQQSGGQYYFSGTLSLSMEITVQSLEFMRAHFLWIFRVVPNPHHSLIYPLFELWNTESTWSSRSIKLCPLELEING